MIAQGLEFLVEEPSMAEFLRTFLQRFLPNVTTTVHEHQGKDALMRKLEGRLRGYSDWLPDDWRIVVVVDRDDDDCHGLKERLDRMAAVAGLLTRSRAGNRPWRVVNRIAIEELEAWYFGDPDAVCTAYPRVPRTFTNRTPYRQPDAIAGGTWEAFERLLKDHGYFNNGMPKTQVARDIAMLVVPERNTSPSFQTFYNAIVEATS